MPKVSRTAAALRITGETLDPQEVSVIMGIRPSLSYRKGEVIRNPKTGRERIPKFGMWNLRTEDQFPGDLDGQIDELLGKLPDDLSIWKELNERFSLDLFTGLQPPDGDGSVVPVHREPGYAVEVMNRCHRTVFLLT